MSTKYITTKLFGDDFIVPVGKVKAGGSLGFAAKTDSNFLAMLVDKDHAEELLRVLRAGETMGSEIAGDLVCIIELALSENGD